ncbi:predicted protein [Plenodomus lingam JN3]|uniref:Predicted protein n=1 Tax=Leptosphaeria maculans (strain JN3 / isolate v23.1.3 / race Av1-4-5-6-7-8) TaxID=985895 RepID=E5A3W3_LEPMJ|nr:predicted protein [Plenodomus lingam JN3]CBX97987.1 predicted protein [Plenodomus lingam JN3]
MSNALCKPPLPYPNRTGPINRIQPTSTLFAKSANDSEDSLHMSQVSWPGLFHGLAPSLPCDGVEVVARGDAAPREWGTGSRDVEVPSRIPCQAVVIASFMQPFFAKLYEFDHWLESDLRIPLELEITSGFNIHQVSQRSHALLPSTADDLHFLSAFASHIVRIVYKSCSLLTKKTQHNVTWEMIGCIAMLDEK